MVGSWALEGTEMTSQHCIWLRSVRGILICTSNGDGFADIFRGEMEYVTQDNVGQLNLAPLGRAEIVVWQHAFVCAD